MKNFILELGRDFIFIDEEYKVQVGNSDFYIDLVFYHRGLHCLVAFELKADTFKPEHWYFALQGYTKRRSRIGVEPFTLPCNGCRISNTVAR